MFRVAILTTIRPVEPQALGRLQLFVDPEPRLVGEWLGRRSTGDPAQGLRRFLRTEYRRVLQYKVRVALPQDGPHGQRIFMRCRLLSEALGGVPHGRLCSWDVHADGQEVALAAMLLVVDRLHVALAGVGLMAVRALLRLQSRQRLVDAADTPRLQVQMDLVVEANRARVFERLATPLVKGWVVRRKSRNPRRESVTVAVHLVQVRVAGRAMAVRYACQDRLSPMLTVAGGTVRLLAVVRRTVMAGAARFILNGAHPWVVAHQAQRRLKRLRVADGALVVEPGVRAR